MITVDAIYTSPVKSLGLNRPESVQVDADGVRADRRFHLVDGHGVLLTQRQVGPLVQVKADYEMEPESLTLDFPGGHTVGGQPALGGPVVTRIWDRPVPGSLVEGEWSEALSDFCGQQVLLVKSDSPGVCYDEHPVSMLSQASVDYLREQSGGAAAFEGRRFRPNFLLGGCEPHQEDSWLGRVIGIGPNVAVLVVARDPRCAITTHDPDSGETDADTLRHILSYRPGSRVPYFGVYGLVVAPGPVSVGDTVAAGPESQ